MSQDTRSGRLLMTPGTYLELVDILELIRDQRTDEAERRLEALLHPPGHPPTPDD